MRRTLALAAALLPAPALAEIVREPAPRDVAATVAALTAAVEEAGARVFATVDHGAGARSVGAEVGDSQLVIFGNPAVGTPVIEASRLAALALPLKILVYEDEEGQVWLAWEAPGETLSALDGLSAEAEPVQRLAGALRRFAEAATR
jgi:uncharacterized protein (DUF302 family)